MLLEVGRITTTQKNKVVHPNPWNLKLCMLHAREVVVKQIALK